MDRVDMAKCLLLKELKCNMETLEERIVIQKKFYLLQEMGFDYGYSYNWYVHGPYSSRLTTYIYSFFVNIDVAELTSVKLTQEAARVCDIINNLGKKVSLGKNDRSVYELLASVLFWYKNALSDENDKDSICYKVHKLKPQFSADDCKRGYDMLNELNLVEAG